MPPQKNIENVSEGENVASNTRPADNLSGSRTVDGKTVQAVQRTNPNFRDSMSDIPTLGRLGKSGSSTGFAITDGDQVIASKTAQGASATEGNPQEPMSEKTYPSGTVINRHGKLLLQTGISNVPEVSQGIQNLDDLEALANGLARGVSKVAGGMLNYLSKPNAVSDSLISIGPTLDNAVNYYANTPADQVARDAQAALGCAGETLENTLGHPLKPEQRGEQAGTLMPVFVLEGMKEPLRAETAQEMGLASMSEGHLAKLGIRRVVQEASDLHMPEVPNHLKHLELRPATQELLDTIERKGVPIRFASSPEDLGHLENVHASSAYRYFEDGTHEIVLPQNAAKIQALEEFLHSTQRKLRFFEEKDIPHEIAEVHAKDFMIRHARQLRLDDNDMQVLQWLKQDAIKRADAAGYTWKE